jgi:hypothetical protein
MSITGWLVHEKLHITSRYSFKQRHDRKRYKMKKSKLMIIALLLGLSLLVVPIVSASDIYSGNSLIKINSKFSSNAILNPYPLAMDPGMKVPLDNWELLNKNTEPQLVLDIKGDHYNPDDGMNYWYITGYQDFNMMTPFTLAKPKLQYHLLGVN